MAKKELRRLAFVVQIRPLTSLTLGGKSRVWAQCRAQEMLCLHESRGGLHDSTSTERGLGLCDLLSYPALVATLSFTIGMSQSGGYLVTGNSTWDSNQGV
jgi:hypothetical protein